MAIRNKLGVGGAVGFTDRPDKEGWSHWIDSDYGVQHTGSLPTGSGRLNIYSQAQRTGDGVGGGNEELGEAGSYQRKKKSAWN